MSIPDWTEAPDQATHYDCNADVFCTVDGWWSCKGKYYHMPCQMAWGSERYTPRPVEPTASEWVDGWPPLGQECIFQLEDGQDYVVLPIAYYEGSVVFVVVVFIACGDVVAKPASMD